MKKVWKIPSAVLAMAFGAAVVLFLACCGEKTPIKVGFVGGLTGRYADLGTAGRDGATLAIEEINAQGGINGRKLRLITKNDRQEEPTALRVDRELIDEGVAAIIGHMTSTMSVAAVPLMNEKRVVMISPTTTTNVLDGKDDYFFRVEPASAKQTESLARHAAGRLRLKTLCVFYDTTNRVYSDDYYQAFSNMFSALGGKILAAETFQSGPNVSFETVVRRGIARQPDGILVIANAQDAADICQQIRKFGSKAVILSSGWAMTDAFLRHGGKAVEGVVFDNLVDMGSRDLRFVDFKNRYRERFGGWPSFSAVHGYEAARLLTDALKIDDNPARLKQTILGLEKVTGLFGDFRLTRFGDAERTSTLLTVQDGRYQKLE